MDEFDFDLVPGAPVEVIDLIQVISEDSRIVAIPEVTCATARKRLGEDSEDTVGQHHVATCPNCGAQSAN